MQIAVIAKEPRPGRVKTRLCPPFTPTEAAELAAAALGDTLRTVAATPASRHVLVLDGRPGPWLPAGFDVIPQRGEGLAERLAAAFEDCAGSSGEPTVLVGMDTPQLRVASLQHAGSVVEGSADERRAVLGPAADGGYWLLGLSQPDARAFDAVPMSVSTTGARQHVQLRRRGYEVTTVETLLDVDTAADAAAVAATAGASAFADTYRRLTRRRGSVPA